MIAHKVKIFVDTIRLGVGKIALYAISSSVIADWHGPWVSINILSSALKRYTI